MSIELKPVSLKREGDVLAIEWADGVKTAVSWSKLRKNCPCATCNDLRQKPVDPFKILTDSEIAAGAPQPKQMIPRGHYAYQIVWNDGHDAGIYTLEMLRELGEVR